MAVSSGESDDAVLAFYRDLSATVFGRSGLDHLGPEADPVTQREMLGEVVEAAEFDAAFGQVLAGRYAGARPA